MECIQYAYFVFSLNLWKSNFRQWSMTSLILPSVRNVLPSYSLILSLMSLSRDAFWQVYLNRHITIITYDYLQLPCSFTCLLVLICLPAVAYKVHESKDFVLFTPIAPVPRIVSDTSCMGVNKWYLSWKMTFAFEILSSLVQSWCSENIKFLSFSLIKLIISVPWSANITYISSYI